MDSVQLADDELISRLSYRPTRTLDGMISIPSPKRLSIIKASSRSSSIGLLDRLPIEVIQAVLDTLDVQSLSRFSRVSLQGNIIVKSWPVFRDLTDYILQPLAALAQTKLISLHSANTLHATLTSSECTSCKGYGAFLFLPTCQRCCYNCLRHNQSLWVIPKYVARRCFDLSIRQARALPTMQSIPGEYGLGIGSQHVESKQLSLTTVRSAKEAALSIYGTMDAISKALEAKRSKLTDKNFRIWRYLQEAPLPPLLQEPFTILAERRAVNDDYSGMASVPFPFLPSKNALDHGLWCLGCEKIWRVYIRQQLAASVAAELTPPGCSPLNAIYELTQREWPTAGFLEHVKHCYGVRLLED